jgi:uncharacterized protein YqeY
MREALSEQVKTAMKARDAERLTTLRMMSSAIKDRDIALRGEGKGPATDQDLMAMLQKMIKQREESVTLYTQAGRADMVAREKAEIAVISEFLPQGLSEAEVDTAIAAAIAETSAAGIKDMGKVVAVLKEKYPGRIDFGKASGRVRAALGA